MRGLGGIVLLIATTSVASAGVLPLDGAYGNETGCAFFAVGEASDDMILLTPDSYLDGKTGCDFDSAVAQDNNVFAVQGLCATPGKTSRKGDVLKVQWKDGRASVYDGVSTVGPLLPCVTVVDPGFNA